MLPVFLRQYAFNFLPENPNFGQMGRDNWIKVRVVQTEFCHASTQTLGIFEELLRWQRQMRTIVVTTLIHVQVE